MKKLTYFLLIAFSLVFVLSCNKEEEDDKTSLTAAGKITKPDTVPEFNTAAQKANFLNNYSWYYFNPLQQPYGTDCKTKRFTQIILKSRNNDLFTGNLISVTYSDTAEEGNCNANTIVYNCTFDAATNILYYGFVPGKTITFTPNKIKLTEPGYEDYYLYRSPQKNKRVKGFPKKLIGGVNKQFPIF